MVASLNIVAAKYLFCRVLHITHHFSWYRIRQPKDILPKPCSITDHAMSFTNSQLLNPADPSPVTTLVPAWLDVWVWGNLEASACTKRPTRFAFSFIFTCADQYYKSCFGPQKRVMYTVRFDMTTLARKWLYMESTSWNWKLENLKET